MQLEFVILRDETDDSLCCILQNFGFRSRVESWWRGREGVEQGFEARIDFVSALLGVCAMGFPALKTGLCAADSSLRRGLDGWT